MEKLQSVADKLGATPAQLSLAWLYTKAEALGVKLLPIPGTTSVDHLESNVSSLKFVPLEQATVTLIDTLKAQGERYEPQMNALTFDGHFMLA